MHSVSSIYETVPVGGPPGQGPYLNAVVALGVDLEARELLHQLQRIELEAGRVRLERWGPRTLDLDILFFDDEVITDDDLVVPHPRVYERPFVLAPLEELAPQLVPTDWRARFGGEDGLRREIRRVGKLLRSPDAEATGTVP